MSKLLCIIHANCQGDTLQALLRATPEFNKHYHIIKITNYLHEPILPSDCARCALFLYQELGAGWGDMASHALLKHIPKHAIILKIPNIFFNGYWPLWTNATHMAYGDMLLEYLASCNYTPQEMLHIALHGNLQKKIDMDDLMAVSQKKEAIKEHKQCVQTLPLIQTLWRTEKLFYTVNHPGPRLSLHVADGVLAHLGMEPVPVFVREALYAAHEEFEQPIHPHVARYFQLPFATDTTRYNVYGQRMSYAEYATAYVQCRTQNTEATQDFVVYLHLLAQQAKGYAA